MNEQPMQAYIELIDQLLDCPQGWESEVLQLHGELIDAELLAMMETVADVLDMALGNAMSAGTEVVPFLAAVRLGYGKTRPGEAAGRASACTGTTRAGIRMPHSKTPISTLRRSNTRAGE